MATNQTNEITRYSAQLISNLITNNQTVINEQIIELINNIKNVIIS